MTGDSEAPADRLAPSNSDSGSLGAATKTDGFLTFLRETLPQATVLVLLVAWIYAPVRHGQFLWDDTTLVTNNWMVQSGELGGLAAIWVEPDGPDYFPLTYTLLWLEWLVFGDDPTGYHITNIVLHACSGLLLWGLLVDLRMPGGWLAAVVFAVHPVCVESVAWVSEVKNTLSLPLFLLACRCWIWQDDRVGQTAQKLFYGGSLLTFTLALLAKPTVVGMPLLTLLYAWWKRQTIRLPDVFRMFPFFLAAAAMGLLTVWFHRERAIVGEPLPIGGLLSRVAVAGPAMIFYLTAIIWPVGLIPAYPQWSVKPVETWQLIPWVGFVLIGWVAWRYREDWGRQLIFAGGFFLLMVAPVLGFIDMSFMRISWVSDHFLYVPMIGPIAGLIAAVSTAFQNLPTRWQAARWPAGFVLLGALTLGSRSQATLWADERTLWTATVRENDNAWQPHMNLGVMFLDDGDVEQACRHFSRAASIRPDLGETQHCFGVSLVKKGNFVRAIQVLERSILSATYHPKIEPTLLRAYVEAYQTAKAIELAEKLLAFDPGDISVWLLYARALMQSCADDRAAKEYEEVLQIDSLNQEARHGLSAVRTRD